MDMSFAISVENIKCGGCASTIRNKIAEEAGVESVEVNVDAGLVTVHGDVSQRDAITTRLAQLGYPEAGSVEGMKAAAARAKSFVSCAIGRLDDGKN
jgi:copper chaperone